METFESLLLIEKRRDRGFTLLEVIVTLTVIGFILLIIFGAFRLGFSAWDKGESLKEEYQRTRMISQLIAQQMKSAVPYKIKTKKAEGDYLAFEGDDHSVKFVSAFSVKAKESEGFVFAAYDFRREGREGGRLVFYEQRALNKDFFEERPKEELEIQLLEGVSNVQFEYYREEDPDENRTEEWVPEWNAREEKELPRAFRMTITYAAAPEAGQSGQTKEKKVSIQLLASIPAHQLEELRTAPPGIRGLQQIPQRRAN
ncbi:MAG: type II secretion system protein J [Thermodesulfobacteriota bacterium]